MDLLWLALDSGPPIPALGLLIFLPIFLPIFLDKPAQDI
jgi:hypothetical protein